MAAPHEVDIEAAIAEFLGDDSQTSLELPPMATEQRKRAKAIADRHEELTCESFGLGAERRLHLFKKGGASEAVGRKISVKNTFIDDWVSAEAEDGAEAVVFRSMPTQLPRASLLPPAPQPEKFTVPSMLSCGGKLDLSPIGESEPKWPRELAAPQKVEAPGHGGEAGARGLPTLLQQQGCQVRNTFIHVDSGAVEDERSIQSMPHDMFRQCLEEEAALRGAEAAASGVNTKAMFAPSAQPRAPEVTAAAPALPALVPGARVVIQGLMKLPAFNGKSGVIMGLDEASSRYSVQLTVAVPGLPKHAKVKAENLRIEVAMPPPPPFAPALDERFLGSGAMSGLTSMPSTPQWAEDVPVAASPLRLIGRV